MNFLIGIILVIMGLGAMMSSDDKKADDPNRKKLLDSFTEELDELERQEQVLRQEVEGHEK